jgi:hypothetical protein
VRQGDGRATQLLTPSGIDVEVSRDDDSWVVVAANTIRSRNASLATALGEALGPHAPDEWIRRVATPRAPARKNQA